MYDELDDDDEADLWLEWSEDLVERSGRHKEDHDTLEGRGDRLPFTVPRHLCDLPASSAGEFRPGETELGGGVWSRDPLFSPGVAGSEISLAWSIFQIMGTPNERNWPVRHLLPPSIYHQALI